MGQGRDGLFFQEQGLAVVCTDLSPQMVALCRQKNLTAHIMDFYHLGFPADSFDAVFAMNCLLHVPKPDLPQVLSQIRRVLRPGGLWLTWQKTHSSKLIKKFNFFEEVELLSGELFLGNHQASIVREPDGG